MERADLATRSVAAPPFSGVVRAILDWYAGLFAPSAVIEEITTRLQLPAPPAEVWRSLKFYEEVPSRKPEIRALARELGMPTWDEPASACLSSRIPYKSEVTETKLGMIEKAEEALRRRGFRVCRVRHHDTLARVELGRDELARAIEPEMSAAIVADLKAVGYQFVCLDLQGYRTGSLNEILTLRAI